MDLDRRTKLIDKIIIHCSDTDHKEHDNIEWIRKLHKDKGWSDIGYHFFIDKKGKISEGRNINKTGAHCLGQNLSSIGICLSGRTDFTEAQFRSALFLINGLMKTYHISRDKVFPHNHFALCKTCPNFALDKIWKFENER
jgi:N-acetylmuramoyl-L-alanine amidase